MAEVPTATRPSPRRITERGSLEIQSYDEVCFHETAAEWAKLNGRRPFLTFIKLVRKRFVDPRESFGEVGRWGPGGGQGVVAGFDGDGAIAPG